MKDPEKLDKKYRARWSISISEYDAIFASFRYSPFKAFDEQRYSATRRSIPFNISFPEWWSIWQQSGHWDSRGRKRSDSYVMSRIRDEGGYEVGNVRIVTMRDNMLEFHAVHGKLDAQKASAIRAQYIPYNKSCNISALARRYGVSPTTIKAVLLRRTWWHV